MKSKLNDIGLLTLRVVTGTTLISAHGMQKILTFNQSKGIFPDPIGIGSTGSLMMAILSEVGFSLAIALGIRVRYAAMGLFSTMFIIFTVFHKDHAWEHKELSFLYALISLVLVLTGGGNCTVDRLIQRIRLGGKLR